MTLRSQCLRVCTDLVQAGKVEGLELIVGHVHIFEFWQILERLITDEGKLVAPQIQNTQMLQVYKSTSIDAIDYIVIQIQSS